MLKGEDLGVYKAVQTYGRMTSHHPNFIRGVQDPVPIQWEPASK